MLILSRKLGQKIYIGPDIVVTVVDIDQDKVRLGIDAPKQVEIRRDDAHSFIRKHPPATEVKK